MDYTILGIILTVASFWVGSIEWRIRTMDSKLRDAPSREEVRQLIDTKQEALNVRQDEIKEDVKEIKIDLKEIRNAVCSDPRRS